jgi:release factor glutamine methyltransferase
MPASDAKQALGAATDALRAVGVEDPRLDAEVLLAEATGQERAALVAGPGDLPPAAARLFGEMVRRRLRREPVAYIVGRKGFRNLELTVDRRVLVPRPETELLVEVALERAPATLLDVGTGSGAIALSVATAMPPDWPGEVIASDVSPAALTVAKTNRNRLSLTERVTLVQGSLLDWRERPVDLILANLPYLTPRQIADNSQLAAEPRLALDGGEAGLDLIRHLLADAPRVLAPAGAIGLEIDPDQRDAVITLARASFPDAVIGVLPDLAGRDRHVTIETAAADT